MKKSKKPSWLYKSQILDLCFDVIVFRIADSRIIVVYLTISCVNGTFYGMSGPV
jgi:hypothetical protein